MKHKMNGKEEKMREWLSHKWMYGRTRKKRIPIAKRYLRRAFRRKVKKEEI